MNEARASAVVSDSADHTPNIWQKATKTKKRKLLTGVLVLVVLVAAGLTCYHFLHTKNVPAVITNADVNNATKVVTSNNSSVSQLQTYGEAYDAGQLYQTEGKYQQAYDAFQRAEKLTTQPPMQLYLNLAQLAKQLGLQSSSKAYYQKVISSPDFSQYNSTVQSTIKQAASQ